MTYSKPTQKTRPTLPKAPTGIKGLDEITGGGIAKGASNADMRWYWLWQNIVCYGVFSARRTRV